MASSNNNTMSILSQRRGLAVFVVCVDTIQGFGC